MVCFAFDERIKGVWDLHRLQMLHELRYRGTITAVGQALNYSPSTVSQHLAKLEAEVGVRLIEPDGRRVRLTPQGHAVARYVAQVMDLEEGVRSALASAQPVAESVRIATLETTGRALLPRALTLLSATHPHLRIEASVVPPELGLAELEARGFDLAIAEQYPTHTRTHRRQLDRQVLGTDGIRLAVPSGSPVAGIVDTAGLPWVVEPPGSAARAWSIEQCRQAGFEPDIRFDSADLEIHIHLIRAGHAVGLLPDLVWSQAVTGIRLIEMAGPSHREIFTSVRRTTADRPAIHAVRQALTRAFAELRSGPGPGPDVSPDPTGGVEAPRFGHLRDDR